VSIQLIVLDVDGTMTDGRITYTENGDEIKSFSVKDGLAIASWRKLGRHVAIITGRTSSIVQRRAQELGIEHFYQGIENKKEVLDTLLDELGLNMDNVAAIGDDLNDFSMLKAAKKAFVPLDATLYLNAVSPVRLSRNGGDAAVREMIEMLIVEENLEEKYLDLWL